MMKPETVTCPSCQQQAPETSVYCPHCQAKLFVAAPGKSNAQYTGYSYQPPVKTYHAAEPQTSQHLPHYTVCHQLQLDQLVLEVNKLISQGWKPLGGLVVQELHGSQEYLQAMGRGLSEA